MASVQDDVLTDEQIQQAVADELRWDAQIQPNSIGVIVDHGVVTLTGWVDSYYKKWMAEEAALRVPGVVAVANDIEVRLPTNAERTDADIAAAAAHAIAADPFLPDDKIHISVSKGWLTLRGEVDMNFQRRDAERAVAGIRGVRGVTNLIAVAEPWPRVSPTDLKKRVEQAILRSAEADARNIDVEVNGSEVTLKGTVHSWAERRAAERAAWDGPGVTAVHNHLRVRVFAE
jgi:osmotically-inducible protein OsmY